MKRHQASQVPDTPSVEQKEEVKTSLSSQTSIISPKNGWQLGWLYATLAMEFVGGVVGGGLAGFYLDHWQGTSPLWTSILLVSGCAAGLFLLLHGITKLEGELD